ncbi:MAG: hypothetical protein JF603_04635 [Acidobacteria bacterium]|nr:hypothetical protein [Acidobacteriota bacterium]
MAATLVRARTSLRDLGWVATLGAGVALVPWLFVASSLLPAASGAEAWSAGWALLDAAEAVALFATGALLHRGSPRARDAAAVAAGLLLADAWLDVATASSHRVLSLLLALFVEAPLAVLCGAIAVRRRTPSAAAR